MERFFSVVIAAYNASDFIEETLDSVRMQTYRNYEVIVVDDGSPVCMQEAIEAYHKKYPEFPLRYVWQENEGPAGARKKCVDEAQYDYIAFLDHDDMWYESKLTVMNETMNRTEADIYYHDENETWEDGSFHPIHYRELGKDPVTDLILKGNTLSTSAVIIKRKVFLECNPYADRKRTGEDYECWIRLAKFGAKFYHVPQILGEYRRLPGSLTRVNIDYTRSTNEQIVGFYDYLDRSKFTEKDIDRLKNKRRAFNEYLSGRFYHESGDFYKARKFYKKSLSMGNYSWKCFAAMACALIKKRI